MTVSQNRPYPQRSDLRRQQAKEWQLDELARKAQVHIKLGARGGHLSPMAAAFVAAVAR